MLEQRNTRRSRFPTRPSSRLFDFFDDYQWHLDERPLRADNEINPDVLGYIFEKYVNQKQMGAYYTKEDITGYIAQNTVIPRLFDMARKDCAIAFRLRARLPLPPRERVGVRGTPPPSFAPPSFPRTRESSPTRPPSGGC